MPSGPTSATRKRAGSRTEPRWSGSNRPASAHRAGGHRLPWVNLRAEVGEAFGRFDDLVELGGREKLMGLQVPERTGAAYGHAHSGSRNGIGDVDDDHPVVVAEHPVVGVERATHSREKVADHPFPVTWSLHHAFYRMAREVEKDAYFAICAP